MVLVLLSALVERFSVSRQRDLVSSFSLEDRFFWYPFFLGEVEWLLKSFRGGDHINKKNCTANNFFANISCCAHRGSWPFAQFFFIGRGKGKLVFFYSSCLTLFHPISPYLTLSHQISPYLSLSPCVRIVNQISGVRCCMSPVMCHMSQKSTTIATDPPPANFPLCTVGWFCKDPKINFGQFLSQIANSETTSILLLLCRESFCNHFDLGLL